MPYVHEDGTFSTIMKALGDLKDLRNINKSRYDRGLKDTGSLQRSSIMRASKDLVMSFPVLCSNTLTPSTASMISKAVERNCVTTLQLLFSSAYLQGYSGQEVLKKWHNNIDNDMSMDEYMDLIDSVSQTFESGSLLAEAANYETEMIDSCVRNTKRYPLSSFSENSICSFSVREGYNGYTIRQTLHEAPIIGPNGKPIGSVGDFYHPGTGQPISKDQFDAEMRWEELKLKNAQLTAQTQSTSTSNTTQSARARKQDEFNQAKLDFEKQNAADRLALDRDKFDYSKTNDDRKYALDVERNRRGELVDQQGYFTKQLLDSDVKKCNELVPSMIIVKYDAINPNTADVVPQQFIAGVKARLIPCDSFEIMDRIRSIEKNKISLINLVRATTKEISFARDFVAGIEQAKIEAKQNSKLSRTSPIWRSLQTRATKSGMNRLKKGNRANDAGAITTLVVSQEEVNFLKKEYNIDINIPSKAKFVMESYNLMGLVIVDESVEVARFLFDGEKYFQDYSFGSLERETGDSSYKKVINLISKINRG